jgi:hypothetical protein
MPKCFGGRCGERWRGRGPAGGFPGGWGGTGSEGSRRLPRRRREGGEAPGRAARDLRAPSQTGPAGLATARCCPRSARRPSSGSSAPRVLRCRGARSPMSSDLCSRAIRWVAGVALGLSLGRRRRVLLRKRRGGYRAGREHRHDRRGGEPALTSNTLFHVPACLSSPSVTRSPLVGNDARRQSEVCRSAPDCALWLGAGRDARERGGILALRLGPPRQTMRCWLCHAHRRRPGPPPSRPHAHRAAAAGVR